MYPSSVASIAFIALVIVLLVIVCRWVYQRSYGGKSRAIQIALILVFWLSATAFLAASGTLSSPAWLDATPPRFVFFVIPAVLTAFILPWTPLCKTIASNTTRWGPVLIQSFRIPMELILWGLVLDKVIPVRMSFEGANFDVVSGTLGLAIGVMIIKRPQLGRGLVFGFHIVGLLFLAVIVSIAIMSTPTVFRHFQDDVPNTVVFHWPFFWLPTFVVPVAIFCHMLSMRIELMQSASEVPADYA